MWMYQFWLFSFKTAKYWGRDPSDWTAEMLGFENYHQRTTISFSLPSTPAMIGSTPPNHLSPGAYVLSESAEDSISQKPSPLCRWSIHYETPCYETIPSPPGSPQRPYDSTAFTKKLSDNLQTNDFSNIATDDIPIAVDQIAGAAQRSASEFQEEALGFGIMSGNSELVADLVQKIGRNIVDSKLYPFHLAISYLKGSKDCCLVLEGLLRNYPPAIRKLYVNDLGHTVLDQVMITILKAHTSCWPSVVDFTLKKENRFEGEDVDICGRWDADSDCLRTLLAKGIARTPFEWKHVFCHTSAQAICHCIRMLYGPPWGADINCPSGLFVRRCLHCGLKMELKPLHALVLTGLHLCLSGCEGETIFGLLAVLLCLLRYGANPLLKAKLSLHALLGNELTEDCDHEELYPVQLAEKVPTSLISTWSNGLRTGWQLFCNVLRYSHANRKSMVSQGPERDPKEREKDSELEEFMDYSEDNESTEGSETNDNDIAEDCNTCEGSNFFGDDTVLPSLWAATQTELLTYRRLEDGTKWISRNFDMAALNESFRVKRIAVPFLKEGMMKSFCSCGEFIDSFPTCPIIQDATAYYFSNLEDWNRSNFIPCPEADYWSIPAFW